MQLINSILKRMLWAVLLGGVIAEWSGMMDMDGNPGMMWVYVIPIYIVLTIVYNKVISNSQNNEE